MKPQARQQLVPLSLLIGAIVCGGISWFLDGTAFWIMVGIAAVLITAGLVTASRAEAARRDGNHQDRY